ncbi:MAG: alkaline phosphatase D family protein [Actinobacteria bacterium]|nr:alkaline phosphatase D family protein [Actinomycetota bacterium]
MQRRAFLASVGIAGGVIAAGCAPRPDPTYPIQTGELFEGIGPYPSGVGSGDPTPDSVLLWTRAHPERDTGQGLFLTTEVSTSPQFGVGQIIAELPALATAQRDHCVTINVTGLQPATTYWYRFRYDGLTSPIGRTRTSPVGGVDRLRLAAFSCQRYTHGFYTAHSDLAGLAEDPSTDLDLVLCLGDYVYETGYANSVYVPGRDDPIQQAVTQDQFRAKYRMYRSDPDLQAVHAAYPMINVFDNHDGLAAPGDNQAAGAIAAFFEHLPVRSRLPGRIDRSLRWGDLAEIFMTDQRSFRDQTLEEEGPLGTSTTERPEILDPNRTMLGAEQRNWLLNGLSGSSAQWKVIGSQLMFWPWRSFGRLPGQPRGSGVYLNLTQWDGYVAERLAILDHLEQNNVRNTLLFSGDSHVFSAAQIAPDVDDPRSTPRIAEFGTGSVTSNNADENGYPTDDSTRPYLRMVNPNHLRFFESERHGYAAAEITPGGTSVEFRSPRTIRQTTSATQVLSRMRVATDTQRVELLAP